MNLIHATRCINAAADALREDNDQWGALGERGQPRAGVDSLPNAGLNPAAPRSISDRDAVLASLELDDGAPS